MLQVDSVRSLGEVTQLGHSVGSLSGVNQWGHLLILQCIFLLEQTVVENHYADAKEEQTDITILSVYIHFHHCIGYFFLKCGSAILRTHTYTYIIELIFSVRLRHTERKLNHQKNTMKVLMFCFSDIEI